MIIYGSRMYGKRDEVQGWGYCGHCRKYGRRVSYSGRKWGHLYFIPLIPAGPPVRVINECKKCSQGMHLPEKDVASVLDSLHESTRNALAALLAGEKEFDDNGTAVPAAAWLWESVDMLLCLQAEEQLRLVVTALQEKQLTHAFHLVNGAWQEFEGKLDQAAAAYRHAAEIEPGDPFPLMSLGSVHVKKNDLKNARSIYEKALQISEDRFPVLQVLVSVYDSMKDYPQLAQTYEECFALVPQLTQDKKTLKAYKKTCKKAGKQPVV